MEVSAFVRFEGEPMFDGFVFGEAVWEAGVGGDDQDARGFQEGQGGLDGLEGRGGCGDRFLASGKVAEVEDGGVDSLRKLWGKDGCEVAMVCLQTGPTSLRDVRAF
jgi:hypothetical protein